MNMNKAIQVSRIIDNPSILERFQAHLETSQGGVNSCWSVMYVLTTLMPDDGGDNPTMEQVRKRAKWDNDDYVCRGLILNGMSDSLSDIYQNIESSKKLWDSLEAKYMAEDVSSKKFLVSNFINYKMTDSRPVMEQYNELFEILRRFTQHKMNMAEAIKVACVIDKLHPSWKYFKHTLKHLKEELTLVELAVIYALRSPSRYNGNKVKRKYHDNTRADPNKKAKPACWKCGKIGHIKRDCKGVNVGNKANRSGIMGLVDGSSNSLKGATVHVYKDRCWFKTYELLNDGSILHTENESTALVHELGCVDLRFSSGNIVSLFNVLHVPNIRNNLVSSSILNNCGYKKVTESNKFVLSKHSVFIGFGYLSNQMFMLNIINNNIASAFISTSKPNDSILRHARLGHVHFKRMQDMSKDGLIPAFDMDTEKCKTCMLTKITKKPFQNVKRETEVLELIHSDLCDLHNTPSLENKKYGVTFIDDALRTESRVLGVAKTLLGERGIECIFVGYAEHSKAFRFYVIEPNDSVLINSIIESRDAIFDENRFSSVPRPSLRIPNGTEDIGGSVVPKEVTEEVVQQPEPELRKSKRNRTPKDFGPEFQLYLIEGTRDEVSDQHSYCFNVEDDPKTFDEAMKSQDVAFWKEAINDEMDSIMGNNTWVLADLPPGCKPLGCKWIFKRKLKVDGTIEKFKARLVIQGFKQKLGIDYFDTYALVARISTIRLLIAMASIHNLIIHQMDVKTTFLNDDLDEEVYMNQPQGFIIPGNENKVCKLIKSLYRLKQAPKQWHHKCVYSKFNESGSLEYFPRLNTSESNTYTLKNSLFKKRSSFKLKVPNTSKKQTCITGSTMESEFMALAAADKEVEWLKNLLIEIPLWSKPITPISICYDSAATLAKAYSQMYNGMSRHLGVRHSMIHELITNGMISIEFVRSQQNLADHLTKGLARDLGIKSAEGMGLKSN
ncbi:zinc finger, CCHC-type containing protein [Tanacetum coccineum]